MTHANRTASPAEKAVADLRALAETYVFDFPACMGLPPGGWRAVRPIADVPWFPFGSGLLHSDSPFPYGGVMVVDQDWGCFEHYRDPATAACKSRTTEALRALLRDAGIDERSCFLTSALIGLRVDDSNPAGVSESLALAWENPAFVQRCLDFFLAAVAKQKPRAIVFLGDMSIQLARLTSRQLARLWPTDLHVVSMDESCSLVPNARFTWIDETHTSAVAALLHPAAQEDGLRRIYRGQNGRGAEVAILSELRLDHTSIQYGVLCPSLVNELALGKYTRWFSETSPRELLTLLGLVQSIGNSVREFESVHGYGSSFEERATRLTFGIELMLDAYRGRVCSVQSYGRLPDQRGEAFVHPFREMLVGDAAWAQKLSESQLRDVLWGAGEFGIRVSTLRAPNAAFDGALRQIADIANGRCRA